MSEKLSIARAAYFRQIREVKSRLYDQWKEANSTAGPARKEKLKAVIEANNERRSKVLLPDDQRLEKVLRNTYGITLAEYNIMFEVQNYCCKICKRDGRKLFVDHCHRTGRVRGLLCNSCNTGIGMFQDNPSWLRSAIEYLE